MQYGLLEDGLKADTGRLQGVWIQEIFIFSASSEDFENSLKDENDHSEMDTSEIISGPRALRSSRFSVDS